MSKEENNEEEKSQNNISAELREDLKREFESNETQTDLNGPPSRPSSFTEPQGPPPPSEFSELRKYMLFELFTGDAMIRGLTNLGYGYLQNLEGSAEDYKDWGITSYERGLIDLALNYFIKYFKLRDFNTETDTKLLNCKGLCHVKKDEHKKALASFNRVLEVSPQNPDALNNIGLILYKRGDYGSAKNYFVASLNTDSSNAIVHWNLSLTQMRLNNISEALDALENAVELQWTYRNRAYTHDVFNSIKDNPRFQEITLSREFSPEEYLTAGEIAYEQQDFSMANYYFTNYLKHNPSDPIILDLKGQCLFHMNYYSEAKDFFQKALNLEAIPKIYYNLGIAYYMLGEYDNAFDNFNQYLKSDLNNPSIYWNIALTQMKRNYVSEALNALKSAIDLDAKYRERARFHEGFLPIKNEPKFKDLVK